MRAGDERRDWTAADERALARMAGEVPRREICRRLRRSKASVEAKAHRMGLSLRCYPWTLVWCDACATWRTEVDANGSCPVCEARRRLEAAEARCAEALALLPPEERALYAATESLRGSSVPPRPASVAAGATGYARRKAEAERLAAVEAWERKTLERRANAAKTRLKRIREKAGANPRKPSA